MRENETSAKSIVAHANTLTSVPFPVLLARPPPVTGQSGPVRSRTGSVKGFPGPMPPSLLVPLLFHAHAVRLEE